MPTAGDMDRWEYTYVVLKEEWLNPWPELLKELNARGLEGWEAVSSVGAVNLVLMKRRRPS